MATDVMNQISARNQINGTVTEIQAGTAMTVVTVSANGQRLTSAITSQAAKELGLKQNDSVVAFIKATEAIIIKGDAGTMKTSARNKIAGRVADIKAGPAMASVTLDSGQWKMTAAITDKRSMIFN